MRRESVALVVLLSVVLLASGAAAASAPAAVYRGVLPVAHFDISPPLRDIKPLRPAAGMETGREVREGMEDEDRDKPLGPQDVDTLVQNRVGSGEIPSPSISFDGPSNISSVSPPDPVGDVGPNHYVAMSNLSFQIFSKTGTSLFGPALNNTLWAGFGGACQSENAGDPIVLYDQLSDRWMLSQFTAAGPTFFNCVAVSQTSDPLGSYYRWAFTTGSNFPDYPKYGWWSDGLYISTREFNAAGTAFMGVGAYAIKRADLISGNPTPVVISFLALPTPAFNVGDGLVPSDLDGFTPPPAGTPNFFVGSMDNGGPYGATQDALTLWKFTADFVTTGNSSFVLANTIPITAYDTIPAFCSGRACVPQPGTTNKIDHLGYRQRPLHRLAYRNFGTHESLVTNQSVEASATVSGIRWWEIRSPNSSPVIYQEGTYAPGTVDTIHRWMGSIAMDSAGNMALGYSASDGTATFPSSWYTGRLSGDALGTMSQGEGSIVNGTGSQTGSNRWGDYTSMNVDPLDDCTFWYVNEYVPSTSSVGWRLRIGAFKFDQCGTPDFYISASPDNQTICTGSNAVYNVNVGSVSGYNAQVTLSAVGNPGTAGFGTNPVTPPGSSTLTLTSPAAGTYSFDVVGTAAGPNVHQDTVGLTVVATAPGAPALTAPANGAVSVSTVPTFTWGAVAGASTYSIQVATDAGFTNIVASATGLGTTTWPSNVALAPSTEHFWRVRANNVCGDGVYSSVFSFTTANILTVCGGPITINDNAVASPYPSVATVGASPGGVLAIELSIAGFTHTFPDDVDMLLVSPSGQKMIFMSDAGGGGDVTGLGFTLADSAATLLSDAGPLVAGTYRPSDVTAGDVFAAPAPAAPYSSAAPVGAATFLNTLSAGTLIGGWNLYVVDDAGQDVGTLGQWCLNFTLSGEVLFLDGFESNDMSQWSAVVP